MTTLKHTTLLAFGLAATLGLNAAYAQQSEHDGHHPENAPAEQAAPQATQPKPQPDQKQGGMMMEGMDHDKMKDMHDQHMGSGHMDDGMMDKGKTSGDAGQGADQGKSNDH